MNNGTLVPFVWRWWWVLLTGALIAGGAGYGAAMQITKTYEAKTQLLVGPLNTTFDLDASGKLARTYAQLGEGRPVLLRAIKATGAKLTATELDKATTIDSNEITRIISVRVQDPDPKLAASIADAIGARLVEMSTKRRTVSSGLNTFATSPEITDLPAGLQEPVVAAATRVFSGSVAGRLHVTEAADVPSKPIKPSIPLIVVLATLGGLLLAAAIGLVWEARDPPQAQRAPAPAPPAPIALLGTGNGSGNGTGFAGAETQPRDRWGALVAESRPEYRTGSPQ
ncbi:MAG: hypothetical protein QOI64_2197 [Solirubrobacteraceae bacterium]|jgi:uncharacterized protein involved in exopolysaccharide biosynthesis|nr:hypothetical protein [Solirubrobacteraceae bacterium]